MSVSILCLYETTEATYLLVALSYSGSIGLFGFVVSDVSGDNFYQDALFFFGQGIHIFKALYQFSAIQRYFSLLRFIPADQVTKDCGNKKAPVATWRTLSYSVAIKC